MRTIGGPLQPGRPASQPSFGPAVESGRLYSVASLLQARGHPFGEGCDRDRLLERDSGPSFAPPFDLALDRIQTVKRHQCFHAGAVVGGKFDLDARFGHVVAVRPELAVADLELDLAAQVDPRRAVAEAADP